MSIQDIAKWLTSEPLGIIILALCTVGGFFLGIWGVVVTVRGVRVRKPCYAVRSNNLVQGLLKKIPDVEISYKGYGGTVENVTVAKVLFFNDGKEPIRKTDVAKGYAISIRLKEGCVILGHNVLYRREQNHVEVTRSSDRTHATISFEYLDFLDGTVVELIHTGITKEDITVEGEIIGAGQPKRVPPTDPRDTALDFALRFIPGVPFLDWVVRKKPFTRWRLGHFKSFWE